MNTDRGLRPSHAHAHAVAHAHAHAHAFAVVVVVVAVAVVASAACAPKAQPSPARDGGPAPECTAGDQRCDGNALEACVDGAYAPVAMCASGCSPTAGCLVCAPGARACDGDTATVCRPDGLGFDAALCDPVQGVQCAQGACVGACAPDNLDDSYIGCEYFPTVTAQLVSNDFAFAVVVANASAVAAQITIDGGGLAEPVRFPVAAGAVQVQELPWVPALKVCNADSTGVCTSPDRFETKRADGGAYRLRSTQPVTVYQFSPLDYQRGEQFSFSNDASLLLPTNALTGDYVVATQPAADDPASPGFLAVTAVKDQTIVTVTPTAASPAGPDAPAFPAGQSTSVVMSRGDVIQLLNPSGDLTGSVVSANRPVQVVSGHYCANIPEGVPFCDHLEDTMFPVQTLGTEYAVTAPALPGEPGGVAQVVRIVATQPGTQLSFDPPIGDAPTEIAEAGQFVELEGLGGDHLIRASAKILVADYMFSQGITSGAGDPAMTLAVATYQYRKAYAFHAPLNYDQSYVNITASLGSTVILDGVPITDLTPIGSSDLGAVRVQLSAGPAGDGNHVATSDEPFGVTVYGYGQFTSYWYPGGLDLAEIIID